MAVQSLKLQRLAKSLARAVGARRQTELETISFLHITKTGGTSVVAALSPVWDQGNWQIGFSGHEATLDSLPAERMFFSIIRNPIERFVSGFDARMRSERPTYDYPPEPDERAALQRFKTAGALAEALSAGSQEVCTEAKHAMKLIWHVNQPQTDWLGTAKTLSQRSDDVVFLATTATLDRDFPKMVQVLKLPRNVRLPTSAIASNRAPAPKPTLSHLAKENLRNWYRDDMDLLSFGEELRRDRGWA